MGGLATFSLFVRKHPRTRPFFLAASLDDCLEFLERLSFTADDIEYLESLRLFTRPFLDHLQSLRFLGDCHALPEGTIFFANEPVIEVTAPIIQAQIVETSLINALNLQSLIATKAARCVLAARGRQVVDFAARRTQGIDASVKVARSSYLAGFAGTSNCLAGRLYGIPVTGTMAHSFIQSFDQEIETYSAFAEVFPESTVLLIDTYDTLVGAQKAVEVARKLEAKGRRLKGVRLDSGDLGDLARRVRDTLDRAGLDYAKIFASGGLDENDIEGLLSRGAPIDAFGVGTRMGVSADAPYLDCAYKLVEYDKRPVAKLSKGKVSLAGEKQVLRRLDAEGRLIEDLIGLRGEDPAGLQSLLVPVMKAGRRLHRDPLEEIRARARRGLESLPAAYKRLKGPADEPPVRLTEALKDLQGRVEQGIRVRQIRHG